jgi:hypothetical protein
VGAAAREQLANANGRRKTVPRRSGSRLQWLEQLGARDGACWSAWALSHPPPGKRRLTFGCAAMNREEKREKDVGKER